MKKIDFKGKTVVVTGGASGIGKATANAFAGHGASVFIVDINERLGEDVARSNSNLRFIKADVADPAEVKAAYENIGKHVDILISNAGIEYNYVSNLLTMPEDKLRRILEVNLIGAVNCARVFLPEMPRGGKVVFVSSIQAFMACQPGTTYQASKAGLIGLTKALAIELASRGINVNVICPGGVATEGMGALRSNDPMVLDDFRRVTPLGRRAWPEEIAYPILFLCSDWANYMTGQILQVDGGMSALGMPFLDPPTIFGDDPDA